MRRRRVVILTPVETVAIATIVTALFAPLSLWVGQDKATRVAGALVVAIVESWFAWQLLWWRP